MTTHHDLRQIRVSILDGVIYAMELDHSPLSKRETVIAAAVKTEKRVEFSAKQLDQKLVLAGLGDVEVKIAVRGTQSIMLAGSSPARPAS